ncbi:hypothetical protein GGX14DRAFT_653217 [Mycena pura]|uniref:UBA domain-containing protein n=1 Tax=Mycena pura TaxID=153505 RepID=A0AAD6V8N0_9AGAR|nr:hypothetical protein GGX14DRAFT_653217 [Mycena pura]
MSDAFADLWKSTAPAKPAPQKLGSPAASVNNGVRRAQNDIFSMLSTSSTPTHSRPITPNTKQAPQKPPPPSSSGGDAFSGLLGGKLGSNGTGTANMTIAERAQRAQMDKLRKPNTPSPGLSTGSAWDGLDSLASASSLSTTPMTTNVSIMDDDWGFGPAPVATEKSPAPVMQPAVLLDEKDDWEFGLGQQSTLSTTSSSKPTTPIPISHALWDDFASSNPSPPARFSSPSVDFDFGDRADNDILGDLGRPVSTIPSKPSTPHMPDRETSPASLTPMPRQPQQRSSSPPPHILGQLIEMGFSITQSRAALADAYSDGTWNVQAAIDGLLASTGGAEGSSRTASPSPARPPRRRPTDRDDRAASPRQPPQERTATPTSQSDLLARTTELGFSLFKNAERAWLQSKEKVQKVYEEHISGEEVKSERQSARPDRVRPKWMQGREDPEDAGPKPVRQRDDSQQLWQNDGSHGRDDGWVDGSGAFQDDGDGEPPNASAPKKAPSPQPTPLMGDLFSDNLAKPRRVSPSRQGTARARTTAPPVALVPPSAALLPRQHATISPTALRTSQAHASTAQEKVALGQYAAAASAYTLAVDALPAGHVLLVPLLNMRAFARLKEGDFRGAEADAADIESIAREGGRAFGAERVIVDGVTIDVGAAVIEAWKRRAEALEGREKWGDAGRDWERVGGAAWAKKADRDEGVRGAGRCRRMANPASATPVVALVAPKPKSKSPPALAGPPSDAVTKFREAVSAQEEEDLAKHQLKDTVDGKLIAWKGGKETNIRALLASLDTVLWPELGLQSSGMKDLVTPGQVKVRYVKAIAKLHPDKAAQATFKSIKSVVPLLDRILVQRFKPDTKTASGIFLPASATSSPLPEATVIAVGPGAPNKEGTIVPTAVKAGDRVLLPGWGGNSFKVGDEEYFLFKDSEILAKIQE